MKRKESNFFKNVIGASSTMKTPSQNRKSRTNCGKEDDFTKNNRKSGKRSAERN